MIPSACQDKIWTLGDNESVRRGFIDLFNALSNDAEIQGLPSATLILPFYDETSGLQPGDWAPEIHLVLRRVESVDTNIQEDDDEEPADEIAT